MWLVEPLVTHNITIMLQYYYSMLFNILHYIMCNVILYYIITVCEAWQNNLCLSGTLFTGCTTLVQVSTMAFIQHRRKKLQIWSNASWKVLISLQGFSWNSKSFNKLLPNWLALNFSQIGKGVGMQKMGENSFMLLCIVLLPLRRYSQYCNFHAYCWVRIPHWIVEKSTKNVRPGGKKSIHALKWSIASTSPKFKKFIVVQ